MSSSPGPLAFDPGRPAARLAGDARAASFDPLKEIRGFDDLQKISPFEDEWLPRRPGAPLGAEKRSPIGRFMFSRRAETTGIPKTRVAIEDFRIDYSLFSESLPDEHFPRGRTG